METTRSINPELTHNTQNAYSRGRGNFMPDQSRSEVQSGVLSRGERSGPPKGGGGPTVVSKVTPDQVAQARAEMERRLMPHDVIEGLAGGPLQHNASLSDSDRVIKAEKLLGRVLSPEQQRAILEAHRAGDSGIGKYTVSELLQKGRILSEFSPDQRRSLMEAGIVGMSPPTRPEVATNYDADIQTRIGTIDPVSFTDTELSGIAGKIRQLYGADYLDRGMLEGFYDDIRNRAREGGPGVNIAEAKTLTDVITRIIRLDDLRTGRTDPRDRDRYATEVAKDFDYRRRIEAETDDEKRGQLEKERKEIVRDIASKINLQGGGIYDPLFEIIIDEENSLEYLINRIVSAPLDSETGDWSLGFYGQNNLDSITNILRTQKDNIDFDEKVRARRNVQYQSALEIEEAVRLAHDVNRSIIDADLGLFQKIAGRLTDERLSRLSKVKGVGVIARLLEAEHGTLVAKDTWINSNNYAEMMGKAKDPQTGLLNETQEKSALESFRQLVAKAQNRRDDKSLTDEQRKEMQELADLEDWQINWAFNIGKAMYNTWLRGAEWISQGKVQKGDKGYVSFPQESIARILNWPQWMLQRFDISESRGGTEWLEGAIKTYQATREEDGYGHMGLEKIGGKKVENFEMPDMTGVRGWWASWRGRQLIMETIPMQFRPRGGVFSEIRGATVERDGVKISDGDTTDLGVLLDTGAITVNGIEFKKLSDGDKARYVKSVFLDENGHLRSDFNRGLGAALYFGLKPSAYGHNPDGPEYTAAKEHIRALIWEKTAVENPLGVIPFLHGLKEEGRSEVKIIPGSSAPQEKQDAWRDFSRKLFQLNELKMQRIKRWDADLRSKDKSVRGHAAKEIGKISLQGIIVEEAKRGANGITFSKEEAEWLAKIREEGKRAAPHLANVRFAYNPFLNDISLEKIDYGIVGAEGYRRMLNDTASFSSANDALIKMMDSPSKYKEPEEIFEAIMPFVQGVGAILGTDVGQRKGYLWLQPAIGMFERGGNTPVHKIPGVGIELKKLAGVEKRLRQFAYINDFLQALHISNSEAQNFAGHHASVWDAEKLFTAGEEAVHAGVISEEEIKKWRKKFGGHIPIVIRMLLGAILSGVLTAGIETPKQVTKDLKV